MKALVAVVSYLAWPTARAGTANVALEDPLENCFEVPGAICLQEGGKNFVVSPGDSLSELALWYQFDKSLPVDDSGHGNHLLDTAGNLAAIPAGPGILGRGASAALDGRNYGVVKSAPTLQGSCWTISMWLYLLEDSVGGWRTLVHRGGSAEQLSPALLLWPDERRLHLRVSASGGDGVLDSTGLVPLRRWTHIAASCAGGVLRLFVNGLRDGEVILEGAATPSGDLHVGRDPWRAGTRGYLDDLRWYNREMSESEIRALALPGITGVGVDAVRLGCSGCTFPDAIKSCETGHDTHLCSLQELFSGGFHTARVMGWLSSSAEVWYHNEQEPNAFSGVRKLGLCCANG